MLTPRRTLALTRETLSELSTADLTRVAGAAYDASGLTCPAKDCVRELSEDLSCPRQCAGSFNCPTWNC